MGKIQDGKKINAYMSPIRLGLIGAGVIGQRHLRAIEARPDITVAGVADISATAEEVAERYSIPFYSTAKSMIHSLQLDGMIVATPTEHHASATIESLLAGRHVLVEKPMVGTLEEAKQIIDVARENQCHVLVGHQRRYYELTTRAREIVQQGEIGQLVCVTGQWNMRKHDSYYDPDWRKQWRAGPILTNLVHEIDLLRYICGDIHSISAETAHSVQGFEKEDAAAMIMRFENGALGTFLLSDQTPSPWSWELATGENAAFPPTSQNAWRIMGTMGALDFPNLTLWKHHGTPPDWRYQIDRRRVQSTWQDAYIRQIEHFANIIRGVEEPCIDAEDAMATVAATLAVFESAAQGNRIVLSREAVV
ncbi:MAG: Gfo/Idh/MocA family oxidoreductase [Acidiferrobacterales bacterium]|nr:Gfo/Idh/MocA family oxidoreductase [Acidiferrobacterales bacterium]